MLYREPKLLKALISNFQLTKTDVSVLYREPKLLKGERGQPARQLAARVSVLYREPKLLKVIPTATASRAVAVSVLYREPKLLKATFYKYNSETEAIGFSALP